MGQPHHVIGMLVTRREEYLHVDLVTIIYSHMTHIQTYEIILYIYNISLQRSGTVIIKKCTLINGIKKCVRCSADAMPSGFGDVSEIYPKYYGYPKYYLMPDQKIVLELQDWAAIELSIARVISHQYDVQLNNCMCPVHITQLSL